MDKPLDQVLLERGMVSPYELRPALEEEQRTGKSLSQVLLERRVLGERELTQARAAQLGLDFVPVEDVNPAPDAVAALPEDVARKRTALPLRMEDGVIILALADDPDPDAMDEIARATGRRVSATLGARSDLIAALDRAYGPRASASPPPGAPGMPPPGAGVPSVGSPPVTPPPGPHAPIHTPPGAGPRGPDGIRSLSAEDVAMIEAPSAEWSAAPPDGDQDAHLGQILNAVIDQGGSDVHLTAGRPPTIRIHGELEPLKGYRILEPKVLQDMVYSMITQRQREAFEDNLELDVSYSLPGRGRFRVNVFQQRDSVGAVMRLIPHELKTLAQLGLPSVVG